MPNEKKIISDTGKTGKTMYLVAQMGSNFLDGADGAFRAAPVSYPTMTEDAIVKGRYGYSSSATAWPDGNLLIASYEQTGGSQSPVADILRGGREADVLNDAIIEYAALPSDYDAAKTAASQTSVNSIIASISTIIANIAAIPAAVWAWATRKLTSAWTDEATPRDMAATGGNMFTGTQPVTITVYQTATTTPINGVFVSVLNAAGTLVLGTVLTDVNGQTKDSSGNDLIMLDSTVSAGYKLSLSKAGVTFVSTTLTQAEVIAGALTVYGTQFVPAVPTPGTQSLYGWVDLLNATIAGSDVVTAEVTYQNEEVQGIFFQSYKLDSTITAGAFSLIVPWDAQILVTIPRHGAYTLTVSQDDYRDLADYVQKGEARKVA